jgi:hypothetical protein
MPESTKIDLPQVSQPVQNPSIRKAMLLGEITACPSA